METRLLNINELAEYLGVTPRWIRYAKSKLSLPAYRLGKALKFSVPEVDDWLKTMKVQKKE